MVVSGVLRTLHRVARAATSRAARPITVAVLVALAPLVAASAVAPASAVEPASAFEPAPAFEPVAMVEALSSGSGAPVVPILFPMQKRVSWGDTWGAARSGHTHEGNDLLVPKMTPLLAVVPGTLDWLNLTGKLSSYNNKPYYNILLRGDDGNDYFYIHLNNDTPGTDDGLGGVANAYAPGLTNGTHVTQGQVIGYTGDSGNAEDTASHLHFEIHLGGYKNPIDPYNSLKAAPTYDEWIAAGGGPIGGSTTTTAPSNGSTTTVPSTGTTTTRATSTTTTTTRPPITTTTTTRPPTTTTTEPEDPGPGGQIDPEAPPFADIRVTDWFYADLTKVFGVGVVNGSGGVFRPYGSVTRAQFAAFLVRAFAPEALTAPAPQSPVFGDVPVSFWGYREIAAASAAG
ncbi:MAG: M23 family metallopeptidase, partial [Thermoleophilia bacterium]|nr:M23 family metallopeptidase [Thermoleophilia bacterium]